jgi:5-methylcytosine-specific restriction endonuclease McrA
LPESRAPISTDLRRAVLLEAGHRCAIPTCRHPTTEIAHIVPWSKVQEHKFENLIALCPNCHTRYDREEIDRKSMESYKRNLPVVASRYSDLERRVLAELGAALRRGAPDPVVVLPGGSRFMVLMAINDGLIEYFDPSYAKVGTSLVGPDGQQLMMETVGACRLTVKGKEFADRWLTGRELPAG